jgi:hypothetical protein
VPIGASPHARIVKLRLFSPFSRNRVPLWAKQPEDSSIQSKIIESINNIAKPAPASWMSGERITNIVELIE